MKHITRLISSIPTVPTRFTGGKNVVLFSDWPLTVVHHTRGGEQKYEKTLFLTLQEVRDLWIQREEVGTVPDGVLEILTFDDFEFKPPDRKPLELWGNLSIEFSLNTAGVSPINSLITLPGTTYGVLQEISLSASAAAVALARVDVRDNQGAPLNIYSHNQPTAQFLLIKPGFAGVKVPNVHNVRVNFTSTVGSTTILLLNYKIGGG